MELCWIVFSGYVVFMRDDCPIFDCPNLVFGVVERGTSNLHQMQCGEILRQTK